MDGRSVTFVPDINVYTASGLRLPLELAVIGDARVIILSFTPQESNIHYIDVQSALPVDPDTSYNYRLNLIEDPAKKGMRTFFKAADGSGYIYSHEDILLLRSTLRPYVKEWAEDGSPKTFQEGAQNAFTEAIGYLAGLHDEPKCNPTTSLDPYLAEIPWNSNYRFGYGINAATGLPAAKLVAVADFTPPALTQDSVETSTDLNYIQTDEQYQKQIQVSASSKFSAFGTTVDASASYGDNIKYSENEITVILKYHIGETEYRIFGPQGGKYALTTGAKALTGQPDDFRKQYGDYFIAGAKYGAQYIATIHIKASSSEEIRTVQTKVQEAWSASRATEEFKAAFMNATKNCTVDMHRETRGGDPTVLTVGLTPNVMIEDLNKFIKSVTKDNRSPLKAYMYRFNQIPDGAKIPDQINVNSCVFSAARDLSNDYLALTTRAKVIADLDANKFQAGVKDAYAQEYTQLVNNIKDNRDDIFADKDQIIAWGVKVKAAKDKFSNLIDRFSFYQKLVAVRSNWPQHDDPPASDAARGFNGYNLSVAVNNDIDSNVFYHDKYSEGYHFGGYVTHTSKSSARTDYRLCYIRIQSNSSHDEWYDDHYPAMANDYLQIYFKSGRTRGGSWEVWAKGFYLGGNQVNYPFMW
jgi:hypothetical protein